MEIAEARAEVSRLVEEWEQQHAFAESASRKAAGLQKIVFGYIEMFPELEEYVGALGEALAELPPPLPQPVTPKGEEAVRRVLQEAPSMWYLVSELVEALRSRNWLPRDSDN